MLYPITIVSLLLTYGIDKYLCKSYCTNLNLFIVLRVYRTPLTYDHTLADKALIIMKFALFVHFAFGYYMYSNSNIFSYEGGSFSFI